MKGKLHGLDLFTGYGGISLALQDYVRPIAYCEIEPYAQRIILSRMSDGDLPFAPIWDNISTLKTADLGRVDIVYGGFPCQDISTAGAGKGLAGERSGLFFELCRVVEEIKPPFVFLENVPAIRTRGLREVVRTFTDMGYDCRWTCVSAAEVGAPHLRKRWFLLANSSSNDDRGIVSKLYEKDEGEFQSEKHRKDKASEPSDASKNAAIFSDSNGTELWSQQEQVERREGEAKSGNNGEAQSLADSEGYGLQTHRLSEREGARQSCFRSQSRDGRSPKVGADNWQIEPNVGRVVDGVAFRVDRVKALGNGVVPQQVEEAFLRLTGA